jgi:BRCA1-associated protein
VWDYAGDGYVHRLIQNKADGKLVELPSSVMTSANAYGGGVGPSDADTLGAEKIEAIGIEYSYLLTSQLDSQRDYYEGMNEELRGRVEELAAVVQKLERELTDVRAEVEMKQAEKRKEVERIAESEHDRARVEKRAERLNEVVKRLEKELREERAVSQGLMKNLEVARGRSQVMDREREQLSGQVKELEEQVRDVMLYLEAREKIKEGVEEGSLIGQAAGGSLQLKAMAAVNEEGSTRKKKGKK